MSGRVANDMRANAHTSATVVAEALGIDLTPSVHVAIDTAALKRVATALRLAAGSSPERARWNDPRYWNEEDSPTARSQYFAVGNAINFRFWSREQNHIRPAIGVRDGEHLRGAMYMWRSLRIACDRGVPLLDARFLSSMTNGQFDDVFTDDLGNNPMSVAREDRLENLRNLGSSLLREWDGQFFNVVLASDGCLVDFATMSRSFRAFDDPVHKLTMVNAILHVGSGIYAFHEDPLPGVDYHLLKQLLRQGVLLPSESLSRTLLQGGYLRPKESTELRRVALASLVRICEESAMAGDLVDNFYWGNRQHCSDERPVCLDPITERQCPFFSACGRSTEYTLPLELTRYY